MIKMRKMMVVMFKELSHLGIVGWHRVPRIPHSHGGGHSGQWWQHFSGDDDDIGDDLGDAMWRDWEVLNDGDDHHMTIMMTKARMFQIRVTPWRDGEAPFISGGGLEVLQRRWLWCWSSSSWSALWCWSSSSSWLRSWSNKGPWIINGWWFWIWNTNGFGISLYHSCSGQLYIPLSFPPLGRRWEMKEISANWTSCLISVQNPVQSVSYTNSFWLCCTAVEVICDGKISVKLFKHTRLR